MSDLAGPEVCRPRKHERKAFYFADVARGPLRADPDVAASRWEAGVGLLPALGATGAAGLAEQTKHDHARLRDLVRGAWSKHTVAQLGELLEKHVRFEERVLSPRAEALLSVAELNWIRDATPKPEGRRGAAADERTEP